MSDKAENTLRQQLVECTRMMVMAELLDYSGHVSARIPGTDHVLIPSRDASRAGIDVDDIVVVDLNSKVVSGQRPGADRDGDPHRRLSQPPRRAGRSPTAIRRCRRCSPWSTGR